LEEFLGFFFPVGAGELLVTALPCLVKSESFRHPGRLYLSSERLCFRSSIMGMEARFSIPWELVEWARLVTTEAKTMHPVRIKLRGKADFDGQEVNGFDIRVFDVGALAYMHACASYFVGTGIFDLHEDSGGDLPVMEQTPTGPKAALAQGPSRERAVTNITPDELVANLEQRSLVWELQRRTTIWHQDWRAPFLPHDYQKALKWMAIEDHYIPHPFIPEDINVDDAAESDEPPISEVTFLGRRRAVEWDIIIDETSDADGWQYAVDFYLEDSRWSERMRSFSHVRRRRWKPTFGGEASSPTEGEQQPMMSARDRLKSTLIKEKGLSEPQIIFEADLGVVPLEALAKDLEADDWEDENNLMMMYFRDFGIYGLEVGAWMCGSVGASKVQGKVRSMDMRVPVPPAPMCPKETRCTSTWHTVTTDDKVMLESVIMSLDVPYGTSFNVVKCDTFTLDEATGNTRMTRYLTLEWVKSIWVQSLVEANVPKELEKDARQWAEVIKRWAQKANERSPDDSRSRVASGASGAGSNTSGKPRPPSLSGFLED